MSDVVNALQFIVLRCLLLTVTMLHYLMFKVLIINTA